MAKLKRIFKLIGMLIGVSQISAQPTPIISSEYVDEDTLAAYSNYWDAFESYEAQRLSDGKKKFNDEWESIRNEYGKTKLKLENEQISILNKSASRYREHLENRPEAPNRPYILLNLAQILAILADHEFQANPDHQKFLEYREEAIALLKTLEKEFPNFSWKDQGLYLRAILLEAGGRKDLAHDAWLKLSNQKFENRYVVFANIALGDLAFHQGQSGDSMEFYRRALKIAEKINSQDLSFDLLPIRYRYIWAAYRAGELTQVVRVGTDLLLPSRKITSVKQRDKIEKDVVQLLGDALYENNNKSKIRNILQQKDLSKFSGAIGLRVLSRYYANNRADSAYELGEWLSREFPLSSEKPSILQITADSYQKAKQPVRKIAALEKLAMLLPANSLWRSRHSDSQNTVANMEVLAKNACLNVANFHYENGLASGNHQEFYAAISFYEIILKYAPNDNDANTWRLREANSYYFVNDLETATKKYHIMKSELKLDSDLLQLASYQAVQAHEQIWRAHFNKFLEKGEDPKTNPIVVESLSNLIKNVDDYALRFPSQNRSIDLLLVAANALRDMENYVEATKFWQRVLILGGSEFQRKTAIRGQIFTAIKSSNNKQVSNFCRQIMNTENFEVLGKGFRNEILGVLSTATSDEARLLNENGEVEEAAILLTQTALKHPDIPNREQMYRDGGYMFAIAGDWGRSEKISKSYLESGLSKYRADMLYLLARAHEYQLRIKEASEGYLELAEKYPNYQKSKTSLERSERLALAEEEYMIAAKAAEMLAEKASENSERLDLYSRTANHLQKANDARRALAIARRRLRSSRSNSDRLKSRLLMARINYESGSEQEGLDELEILKKQIEKYKNQVSPNDYADISAEIHLILGNEQKKIFDEFSILERGEDLNSNISQKLQYFEKLTIEYDQAAAKGREVAAAEARYKIATSATTLVDEISSAASRLDNTFTFKKKNRYLNTIQRLQSLAKRYFSANVLAARKNPSLLKNNQWIKRSTLQKINDQSLSLEKNYQEQIPLATYSSSIADWSL